MAPLGETIPVNRKKYPSFFKFLLYLVPASIFLVLAVSVFFAVLEDAFISFRYAENLAAGQGLVFNPGEPVWGYSNFLWTVILAAVSYLGGSVVSWSRYLGVVSALAVLWISWSWLLERNRSWGGLSLAAPLLLATSAHFVLAAQNGMETLLFTLLALAGVLSYIRTLEQNRAFPAYAIFFFLCAVTRPEGPVFLLASLVIDLVLFLKSRETAILRRAAAAVVLFAVPFGLYTVTQFLYYGYPLPNPYYVKVAPFSEKAVLRGFDYVISYFRDIHALWFVPFVLAALADPKRCRESGLLLFFTAAYLSFVIFVGGDFRVYFYRFIIPVIPLFFLLVGTGFLSVADLTKKFLSPKAAAPLAAVLLGAVVLAQLALARSPVTPFFNPEIPTRSLMVTNLLHYLKDPSDFREKAADWLTDENLDIHPMGVVGRALNRRLPGGAVVATVQCGQVPYYLEKRTVVDIRGLMDNEVTHGGGFDLAYMKKRDIDFLILYYNETPHYAVPETLIPKIIRSPGFQARYALEHVYRQRAVVWPEEWEATAAMLLFRKKEREIPRDGIPGGIKEDVDEAVREGRVTEWVCRINGPGRGLYRLTAGERFKRSGEEEKLTGFPLESAKGRSDPK
ncbi:MAG TPA: hypothetical protein PKL99_00310 [Syntrophales bacterium]|nr:hypothetical protein [Syntrophales bacterium]